MKKLKLISILCALVMLLSSFAVFPAFAGDTADIPLWKSGDGAAEADADKTFALDQSNFNDFWTASKSMAKIYGNYVLTEDVTVNTGNAADWSDASKRPATIWDTAIGGASYGLFGGTFDGQNHTISGVCIVANSRRVALFSGVTGEVKNLRLVNSYIEGTHTNNYNEVAGLTARLGVGNETTDEAFDNKITNCYVDAIIVNKNTGTTNMGTGGIVGAGYVSNAKITDCVFAGSINSTCADSLGGIIGFLDYSAPTMTVTNCANIGTISSTTSASNVGGIVGYCSANNLRIEKCANGGSITVAHTISAAPYSHIGGILSKTAASGTVIDNCLNAGSIAAGNSPQTFVAGFVGFCDNVKATVSNSMNAAANLTGSRSTSGLFGRGYNPGLLAVSNFYVINGLMNPYVASGSTPAVATAWDIKKIDISRLIEADVVDTGKTLAGWNYKAGNIPNPCSLVDIPWSTVASQYVFSDGGEGTVASPYVLNNKNFGGLIINAGTYKFTSKSFKLTEDISINNTAKDGDASAWNPMNAPKSVVLSNPIIMGNHTASFDGNGHSISGIYMNNTDRFTGLVQYVHGNSAIVKDLAIVNSYFRSCSAGGYNAVGTIASRTQDGGTIENCYVDAIVTYDPASVAAADQTYCGVGGIVGTARVTGDKPEESGKTAGTIRNCVFAGTILNGYNGVGGILGFVENTSITISNCLNMGSLYSTKSNCVGAIFGTRIGKVYMDNCANLSTTINNAANVAYEMHGSWSSGNVVVNNFVTVTGFKTANGYLDMNGVTVATAGTAANTTNYKNISEVSVSAFVDATNKVLPTWTYKAGYVPSPSTLFEMKLVDLITSETMGLKTVGDIHSIRISKENPGLRIETIVGNVELINTLKAAGATVEYVTYITAAKYVTGMDGDEAYLGTKVTELTTEALDAAGKKYITVEAEDYLRTQDKDGYTAFAGSVANINNLDMQYLAVGCIIVTFEGETYKFYAEWNVDEANSVSAVATLASEDWRGAEDVENGYVNKIVNTDGTTVYSPYTQVQYDCIKSLISGN